MSPETARTLTSGGHEKDPHTPHFSVVIPLYNKASHIARAIDSVLSQEIGAFELIIVNDGSTDGGEKVVEQYSDPRIRLINQPNSGASGARNTGISLATSSYVAFLDADDAWYPDFLTVITGLISRYPAVAAYATHIKDIKKGPDGQTLHQPNCSQGSWVIRNYFEDLRSGHYSVHSSTICAKRDILNQIHGFDTSLRIGQDQDAWIRLFLHSGIAISNRYGATYFSDADNRSVERADYLARELQYLVHLRDRYLNDGLDEASRRALDEFTSSRIYNVAKKAIWRGQRNFAEGVLDAHWEILSRSQKWGALARLRVPNVLTQFVRRIVIALT